MGFTSGPAGSDGARQAVSYHVYTCGFAEADCTEDGDPLQVDCPTCDQFASDAIQSRAASVRELGGGAFITEFGACSDSDECLSEIARVANRADAALHSWAYWQFKYFHDITTVSGPLESFYAADGSLQQTKVDALSRTYAQAIAGIPSHMQFSTNTGAFRLAFTSTGGSRPTEIYLNKAVHYAEGYELSILNGSASLNGTHMLEVRAAENVAVDVVVARPYAGSQNGTFTSKDGDIIQWSVQNATAKPGFQLSTAPSITWWKQLIVRSDDGTTQCTLWTQDSEHGPKACDLDGSLQHGFLFDYRIEVWKAKTLGAHTQVDTIPSSLLGPLLGKRVSFEWTKDGAR